MGLIVKQATWGDENSATDVTQSVQKQVKNDSYLDLTASSGLVPTVSLFSNTVNLTDEDKQDIKDQAIKNCQGNANDTECMAVQTANLEATYLQTRVAQQNSSANIINGRRLTLDIVDENGNERVVMVPDGQTFKAGTPPPAKSMLPSVLPSSSSSTGSSTLGFFGTALGYVVAVLMTILWAFSVVVTYRVLVLSNHVMAAYILTALAIFIPYSGLVTTPIAMAVFYYIENQQ